MEDTEKARAASINALQGEGGSFRKPMTLKRALCHWRTKGLIQGFLGAIPCGSWINDHLQTTFGGLRRFEDNIAGKVNDWVGLMTYLKSVHRSDVAGLVILEVGSGWYPTLPFCFALAGAKHVYTVDLTRHLSYPLTRRMLNALEPHLNQIAASSGRPLDSVRMTFDRLVQTKGMEDLLRAANVSYCAPQNAAKLEWMHDGSIDLLFSNSVLEHVTPEAIPALMKESWRVLRSGGLILHAVACNDHYAHFDKSISFVNYLHFTERTWRFWNNRLNYQNRLRAPDFIGFAHDSGFRILHESRSIRTGTRDALSRMRIAPQFHRYSSEDLAATSVDFVAAKLV